MEDIKQKKVIFIGQSEMMKFPFEKKLCQEIINCLKNGQNRFCMPFYGIFDLVCLANCKSILKNCEDYHIEIMVFGDTFIDVNEIKRLVNEKKFFNFFAPTENMRYKGFYIDSENEKERYAMLYTNMIDSASTLICYVDLRIKNSLERTMMNYAKHKGLEVINLYRPSDKMKYA